MQWLFYGSDFSLQAKRNGCQLRRSVNGDATERLAKSSAKISSVTCDQGLALKGNSSQQDWAILVRQPICLRLHRACALRRMLHVVHLNLRQQGIQILNCVSGCLARQIAPRLDQNVIINHQNMPVC